MKKQNRKHFSTFIFKTMRRTEFLAVLSTVLLASSCGDIIKARNPAKKAEAPEPDRKSSPAFGECANFQGRWRVTCSEIPGEQTLSLIQQGCDVVSMPELDLSFEREETPGTEDRVETVFSWTQENNVLKLKRKKSASQTYEFEFRSNDQIKVGVQKIFEDSKPDTSCILNKI